MDFHPLAIASTSPEFIVEPQYFAGGANGFVYKATLQGSLVAAKAPAVFLHSVAYQITSLGDVLLPLWEILRELSALLILDHPKIVKLRGIVTKNLHGITVPQYILMDFIKDGTLEPRLNDRAQMTIPTITNITRQVADVLAYIHGRRFIHRDIKPQNIMVNDRFEVMVTDFGVARFYTGAKMTKAMTSLYGAPEVNSEVYDSSVDIYALGCVMMAMLFGDHPPDDHVKRTTLISQLGQRGAHAGLTALIASCLSDNPSARPTAIDIIAALTRM